MKFIISESSLSNEKPHPKSYPIDDGKHGAGWAIDIKTLKELTKLLDDFEYIQGIIIQKTSRKEYSYKLEIYNAYRE